MAEGDAFAGIAAFVLVIGGLLWVQAKNARLSAFTQSIEGYSARNGFVDVDLAHIVNAGDRHFARRDELLVRQNRWTPY
jgi:hypothetical protein